MFLLDCPYNTVPAWTTYVVLGIVGALFLLAFVILFTQPKTENEKDIIAQTDIERDKEIQRIALMITQLKTNAGTHAITC